MDVVAMSRWLYQDHLPDDASLRPIRELLEQYSGMDPVDIDRHLRSTRDEAWQLLRTPTIGRWKFIRLVDTSDFHYRQALRRLRSPLSDDVLLDLGCGAGQVLRQLICDGVDQSRLYGLDLQQDFVDVGYRLFRDRHSLEDRFVAGDVLDRNDGAVSQLRGKITMVHAASFWHLFSRTQQLAVALRVIGLLRPGCRDAIMFGSQVGSVRPGETGGQRGTSFLHNQESFQALWDEAGKLTRTRWKVVVESADEPLDHLPGVTADARSTRYAILQQ